MDGRDDRTDALRYALGAAALPAYMQEAVAFASEVARGEAIWGERISNECLAWAQSQTARNVDGYRFCINRGGVDGIAHHREQEIMALAMALGGIPGWQDELGEAQARVTARWERGGFKLDNRIEFHPVERTPYRGR